jgi:predicted GIY-YIG superfamily endonuclease
MSGGIIAGEQNNMTIGWALKTERKCKRFSKNQKDFLVDKFNIGHKTGRKEDTFHVSESMLHVKIS